MDEKYRQYRFTVDSINATVYDATKFTWNLKMGNIIETNSTVMMSMETINCSSGLLYRVGAGTGAGVDDVSDRIERLQEQIIGYNHGKHSNYKIRCSHVNSRYVYDTNNNNNPLIYCGQLYLQNTNPKESYVFEVNKDICNGEFKLQVLDDVGTGANLPRFTITFILHEYRE